MRKTTLTAILIIAMMITSTTWLAIQAISWARDLPNRFEIVLDGGAQAGEMLGHVVTESMRHSMQTSDPATQLEVIQATLEMSKENPSASEWVRMEFTSELTEAAGSADTRVAAAATELLEWIDGNDLSSGSSIPPPR